MSNTRLLKKDTSFKLKNTVIDLKGTSVTLKFFGRGKEFDKPGINELYETAKLMQSSWSPKDGKKAFYYYHQAFNRLMISTATIIASAKKDEKKQVVGGVYPLRLKGESLDDIPKTWAKVTGNGMWATNDPKGKIYICPQISSIMSGIPRILLVDGAMVRAAYLMTQGKIKFVTAYTRPGNYQNYVKENGYISIQDYLTLKDERGNYVDSIIGMHLKFGAKPYRIDKDGCPKDKGADSYTVLVDYTPYIEKNRAMLLSKIEG